MTVRERISALRGHMKAHGVDVLYVPSDDYHQSEYVSDFFKARAYLSGFTGSAGTLVVTQNDAKLFTDGRYFIQAARQLDGSGIELVKSGTPGAPTLPEWLNEKLKNGGTLAFDGRCVAWGTAEALKNKLSATVRILRDVDFPGLVWPDRPALPAGKITALPLSSTGRTHGEKLADVRAALADRGCDTLVLSSLCDIAWLYNLRGCDAGHTPVFLSFSIVTANRALLFVRPGALDEIPEGVEIFDYDEFFPMLPSLCRERVMLDRAAVSDAIVSRIPGKITYAENPTVLLKARKNEAELALTKKAHLSDGLAVARFMIALKTGDFDFDEISAGDYLLRLRRECAERTGTHFLDESFSAICAFGPNAAIVHYRAEPETAAKIDKSAPVPMLLIDSGGQYLEGTTDITRTVVLGEIPAHVREHYTLVAMGMLRLADAKFPKGCAGRALDALCRMPLWEKGLDFLHGTGHGVGHILSVHEGPNRFHWRSADAPIEPGMITSDEPGYYEENSHGIRIENEIVCVEAEKSAYGEFYRFDTLTLCPIDLDGIELSLMDKSDICRLNAYHKVVFSALSPYLCQGDKEKLAYLTREIG